MSKFTTITNYRPCSALEWNSNYCFLNLKVLLSTPALQNKILANMLNLLIIFHQENNRMPGMSKAHF